MHQRQGRCETRVGQVRVVFFHLPRQEHALVDERAARQGHGVMADVAALVGVVEGVRNDLAHEVELALELVLILHRLRPADENLAMQRLDRFDHIGQRTVVDRHRAEAQEVEPLIANNAGPDALAVLPQAFVAWHEQVAGGVMAGLGQRDFQRLALVLQEGVRNLDQQAGAVASGRLGASGATMLEIFQNRERILHDLVGHAALQIGDEADAARILLAFSVEKPCALWRQPDATVDGLQVGTARSRLRHRPHPDEVHAGASSAPRRNCAYRSTGIARAAMVDACRERRIPPASRARYAAQPVLST